MSGSVRDKIAMFERRGDNKSSPSPGSPSRSTSPTSPSSASGSSVSSVSSGSTSSVSSVASMSQPIVTPKATVPTPNRQRNSQTRNASLRECDGEGEAKGEVKSAAKGEAKSAVKSGAKGEAKSAARSEAKGEVKSAVKPAIRGGAKGEVKGKARGEAKSAVKREGKAKGEAKPAARGEANGEAKSKAKGEVKSVVKSEAAGQATGQAKQAQTEEPTRKLDKERLNSIGRKVDLTAEGRARCVARASLRGSEGPSESRQGEPLSGLSSNTGAQDPQVMHQLALDCQRKVLGKIKREAHRARLVGLTEEEVQEKLKREEESQQKLERKLKAKAEQEQQQKDFEAENCCPICIDVFKGNVVKCHKCKRAFCEACIERWLAEAAISACVWCRRNPRPLIADSNLTALSGKYWTNSQ